MNGKTTFFKITLIIGLGLLFLSFLLRNPIFTKLFSSEFVLSNKYNIICGSLFGFGGGMTGLSSSNLFMLSENPQKIYSPDKTERKKEFDLKEKKLKAKAFAGDISNWSILAFSYILLMMNMPLWTSISALIIFVLHFIYLGVYMKKNGK